ncbi:MAG TPA: DUF1361 domain-containing protein [Patescibacteria group bacterium]|nr:DUF1361 domain-containing protein [Patescibacteria group bacterium]
MNVILNNLHWISFNVLLAIFPIPFGYLMLKSKNSIGKIIFGLIWLFFLPNSLYLITDIFHIIPDAKEIRGFYLTIDFVIYFVLILIGILTFITSEYFFEKAFLRKKPYKKYDFLILFVLNLLVGFGIVLGRFQTVNSWEVITHPSNVIAKTLGIFTSQNLIFYVILFGIVSQITYYSFRKLVAKKI